MEELLERYEQTHTRPELDYCPCITECYAIYWNPGQKAWFLWERQKSSWKSRVKLERAEIRARIEELLPGSSEAVAAAMRGELRG